MIHLLWCDDSGLWVHKTTRARDSTDHPERMKLCPLSVEERDKDTLYVIGPGSQQHQGKSFTNLYLEKEVASDGPWAEVGWVYTSLDDQVTGD